MIGNGADEPSETGSSRFPLLLTDNDREGRSGLDAPDRRTPSRTAVLRLAAGDVRTQQGRPGGQPEAGAAADARDGDRSFGSAPRHEQSRAWTQDISLPAAGP